LIVMKIDPRLHRIVAAQPYPLLFATISGAHLYGFPSPDSDYDLRAAHVLPLTPSSGWRCGTKIEIGRQNRNLGPTARRLNRS